MRRNHTLDGLRGCLAVLVLAHHALTYIGRADLLVLPAAIAVWIFFAISGYVLTGTWDGRYGAFLLRRTVRLWPIYALCLVIGGALLGHRVPALQYAFLPIESAKSGPTADTPAWSLTIEAWAMLLMPAYVWVSRQSLLRLSIVLVIVVQAAVILSKVMPMLVLTGFFFIGAWLTRYEIRWRPLETAFPQWLGRISYPLYLCHWPIIFFAGLPIWATIPLSFAVAEVLTRTVERGSIDWSRRIFRSQQKGRPVFLDGLNDVPVHPAG
jgi:peptidoglycan/LPS O-acetylase OafA/YrhL